MSDEINIICAFIFFLDFSLAGSLVAIAPEDVSTGLAVVYGFSPKLKTGNDHRVGFGFRLGNHADFQILYEFGPQTLTNSIPATKTQSTEYRQQAKRTRRRPILEFLARVGLLKNYTKTFNFNHGKNVKYQPKSDSSKTICYRT